MNTGSEMHIHNYK